MIPIALTFKENKNKYSLNNIGEIMLVHLCTGCKTISKNRIAGDDNEFSILKIYEQSFNINKDVLNLLNKLDIPILTKEDKEIINLRLFGT